MAMHIQELLLWHWTLPAWELCVDNVWEVLLADKLFQRSV